MPRGGKASVLASTSHQQDGQNRRKEISRRGSLLKVYARTYLQVRLAKVRAEKLFEIPLGEHRPRRVVAAASPAAAASSSGDARGETGRAASEGLR